MYHKFVLQGKLRFTTHRAAVGAAVTVSAQRGGTAVDFLHTVLALVNDNVALAKEDVKRAALEAPLHGLLALLRLCWEDVASSTQLLQVVSHSEVQSLIDTCLTLSQEVTVFALRNMAAGHGPSDMPDMCDIDVSISEAISSSGQKRSAATATAEVGEIGEDGEDDVENGVGVPAGREFLMSFCWLAVKECMSLAAAIVDVVALPKESGAVITITEQQIQQIGQTYMTVLTTCRHRGVIESAAAGFTKLCRRVLRGVNVSLYEYPFQWLRACIARVSKGDDTAFSITRRSAGLPHIVQCIVANPVAQVANVCLLICLLLFVLFAFVCFCLLVCWFVCLFVYVFLFLFFVFVFACLFLKKISITLHVIVFEVGVLNI